MNGILNIYKEAGYTSHDVVAILRRILRTKKIGHTGTLDPNAEGVLPICIGSATKLSELLTEKRKTYEVSFRLGLITDTQDIWGKRIEEREVTVAEEAVIDTLGEFIGPILQIPPMYSAVKQNGKKLYELAREGKTVERKSRPVTIYEIKDIKSLGNREFRCMVSCSKGTYIRTLCHDVGMRLGCGAAMTALLRVRSGNYELDTSLKLAEVEQLQAEGKLEEKLIPIEKAISAKHLVVDESFCKWLYAGNPVPFSQIRNPEEMESTLDTDSIRSKQEDSSDLLYYVYDFCHRLIGIYRAESDYLKVWKFFYQE